MSKAYVLYNPHSGNGAGKAKAEALQSNYDKEIVMADITKVCADYKSFFESISPEDEIIISGGDGTLNRFVNDTEGLDYPNDVLYYATGTGNDFLRDMGKEEGCAPFSIKETIADLPIATVNGKEYRFFNAIGYGIDGYCCEVGDRLRAKNDGKPINYTKIAIMGLLFHYKPKNAVVTVDGVVHQLTRQFIMSDILLTCRAGSVLELTVLRNGTERTFEVTLDEAYITQVK